MNFLSKLNEAQAAAVTSKHNRILCLAGAGTGKTSTLTNRVAYLHEDRNSCSSMLALTFTRLAGKEMKERVTRLIGEKEGKKLFCNTFHAFCVRVLKEYGKLIGYENDFSIYDQEDTYGVVSQIILDFQLKVKADDVIDAMSMDETEAQYKYQDKPQVFQAIDEYEYRLRRNNAFDFSGLITHTIKILKEYPEVQAALHRQYKYVFVDEFQDTSNDQWELVQLLDPENLFVVGDDFQCQPAGTLIDTPHGKVPIEKLRDGDEVLVWSRKSQYVSSTGYKIEVGVRPYYGYLINIYAANLSTKATPNHKFLVRWNNRDSSIFVTYLMYRHDRGYRVGWCQLFNRKRALHVTQRARLEKAEKLWILNVHKDKKEATVYESAMSIEYGIPTCMFEPNNVLYTNETLVNIFKHANPNGGQACLEFHGLKLDLPFYPYPNQRDKTGRPTYFECFACNLIPGYMSIPLPGNKHKPNQWAVVKKTEHKQYAGLVYSLNVDSHHNYIADGIVTLNCIYGWRRANIDIILSLAENPDWQIIKLEQNYRSTKQIVDKANTLIKHNRQTEKILISVVDGEEPRFQTYPDMDIEARQVAFEATGTVENDNYSDIAVLARTNRQLETVKSYMDFFKVPSILINNKDDVLSKPDIKSLLSVLQLAVNNQDDIAFKRTANFPDRRLTELDMMNLQVMATDKETGLYKATIESEHAEKIDDLTRIINDEKLLRAEAEEVFLTVCGELEILKYYRDRSLINRCTDIEDTYMKLQKWTSEQKGSGEDYSVSSFLKWLRLRDIQEKLVESQNAVKLMTVHASKGLEFNTVFVIGMNQGTFPSKRTENLEEERRLFYVAMTRAKCHLYISRPVGIQDWSGRLKEMEQSQFIEEAKLR